MIARYTRPAMGRIWTEENKYRMWLEVEATASDVLANAGIVPHSAAKAIRSHGDVDVTRIQQIECEGVQELLDSEVLAKPLAVCLHRLQAQSA